jgi:hypothetical protein
MDAPTNHPSEILGGYNPPSQYTMAFVFQTGNAGFIAQSIEASQTPNLAKVTFTNGQVAGVSVKADKISRYWNVLPDGNLTPKFLTEDGRLVPTFEVKNLNGTLMILDSAAGSGPIKL